MSSFLELCISSSIKKCTRPFASMYDGHIEVVKFSIVIISIVTQGVYIFVHVQFHH